MNVLDLLNQRLSGQARSFAEIDPLVRAKAQQDDPWLNQNAPFPTMARPNTPPLRWTNDVPVLDPADPANYGPGSPFGQRPPSPDTLDQLNRWWNSTQQDAGLPAVVRNSIRNQPSYAEGEIMAPEQWWNPALGGQLQTSGPQRDVHLPADLADTRDKENWPVMREGEYVSRRPPGVSPFADPFDQLLSRLGQRVPLALY